MPHVTASAFRTDADIYVPGCFQKFRHRQIGIFFFETLVPLDCKDQFQVSGLILVIQESILPDLLKTGWQHMHQETPDEFHIRQGNRPTRPAGLSAPGRKRHLLFAHGQDTAA